jgi:hypothetical protein
MAAKKRRPATTPQGRENQLAEAAVALAEQKLLDGTASSQIITHYLQISSPVEQAKRKLLEKQIELIEAKIESIRATRSSDETYMKALDAIRRYTGAVDDDTEEL